MLEATLDRYAAGEDSKLDFDAIKISHHGSKATVSKGMLDRVNCSRYLISTNGTRHDHPHREAISRIVKFGGDDITLFCNYRSQFNQAWNIQNLRDEFEYEMVFPTPDENGTLRVDLMTDND